MVGSIRFRVWKYEVLTGFDTAQPAFHCESKRGTLHTYVILGWFGLSIVNLHVEKQVLADVQRRFNEADAMSARAAPGSSALS